jgi:thioredoxin reductase (NADPH)
MNSVHDIVIVGSGPAGYTAAIYAARAGRSPIVIEGSLELGGALMLTSQVENFPGFPGGVEGPQLVMMMREQAERFGAQFVSTEAVEVDVRGDKKRVIDGEGGQHVSRTLIIATGSRAIPLGLANEARLTGAGVHTCATCDAAFFENEHVAVVGGGDSAMEEAILIARFATSVTVIHRRSELRASHIMQTRAFEDPKISFEFETLVTRIDGETSVDGLELTHASGEVETRPFRGLFVAIGHQPRSELFAGQVDLDAFGHVVVASPTTHTSCAGVFGAGDVVDGRYRQAVTAAGSGCAAALDAESFLQRR